MNSSQLLDTPSQRKFVVSWPCAKKCNKNKGRIENSWWYVTHLKCSEKCSLVSLHSHNAMPLLFRQKSPFELCIVGAWWLVCQVRHTSFLWTIFVDLLQFHEVAYIVKSLLTTKALASEFESEQRCGTSCNTYVRAIHEYSINIERPALWHKYTPECNITTFLTKQSSE